MKLLACVLIFAAIALAQTTTGSSGSGLGPRKCQNPTSVAASCVILKDVGVALGEQCGTCYGGLTGSQASLSTTTGNQNLYCSDKGSACGLASGGTFPTCLSRSYVTRGQGCDPASSSTFCTDPKYPIGCLGKEKVCGSGTVFDAGQSCAQSTFTLPDFTGSPYFGCKQNECVGGSCNSTSGAGCSPAAVGGGVPVTPGFYCNQLVFPFTATSRLSIGAECTNSSGLTPCVWNAACVSDGNTPAPKFTCVKYGTATVGQPCNGNFICTGDLACVSVSGKLRCQTPISVGNACSFGSASQCDSSQLTSVCACDYGGTGAGVCIGTNLGVKRTNAWQDFTDCVASNGCTLVGLPYYESCVDNNCASEYKSFLCTTDSVPIKSLKKDNTGAESPCGSGGGGSAASTVFLAAAAVLASVAALLL